MIPYFSFWCLLFFSKLGVSIYLSYRQVNKLKNSYNEVPVYFNSIFNLKEHQDSIDYAMAKIKFGWIEKIFSTVLLLIVVFSSLVEPIQQWITQYTSNVFFQTILLFGILEGISLILGLPWQWYEQFVLEEKFGFNRMTPKLFITDLIKNLSLGSVLGTIVIFPLIYFMTQYPASWSLLSGGFLIFFQLFLMWIFPTFLAPLFNKFTPLEKGDLHSDIEKLFSSVNRPAKDIFVMDASKRSSHGNAYFTGIGKSKRIVFYDTLLKTLAPKEVIGVLAHELGHMVHKHIIKMMSISILITLLSFVLLQFISLDPAFYDSFGLTSHPAILLLMASWWAPVLSFFVTPVMSFWSRKNEFEADGFAMEHSEKGQLKEALFKLYKENKNPCVVDSLYASFYFSHPPLFERIQRL